MLPWISGGIFINSVMANTFKLSLLGIIQNGRCVLLFISLLIIFIYFLCV